MAADPYRALVVLACVVAAAVGGVALPATEYGGVPGSDVDVVDSSEPSVPAEFPRVPWEGTPAGSGEGSEATRTATDEDSAGSGGSGSATATATPTDTAAPGDPNDGRNDGVRDRDAPWLGWLGILLSSVVVLVVVAAVVRLADRSGLTEFGVLGRLPGLPDVPNPLRAIAARTTAATLSAPAATARLGHALQEAVVGAGSALGSAVGALARAGRMQASAFGALASALGGVGLGLPAPLSDLTPRFGREDLREARPSHAESPDDADRGAAESHRSVADAWAEMRRLVAISNVSARTPAEVARAAVDQGLPREPVMRLTDAFRDVTYGRADPEGFRETAVLALRALRDAAGGED